MRAVDENFGKVKDPKQDIYSTWRKLSICILINLNGARLLNAALKYVDVGVLMIFTSRGLLMCGYPDL